MNQKPANLVLILSDQHSRDAMGCQGHPVVKTPNLDQLAARGTRFQNAYVNCAVCVPSRASLLTGRYVHDVRCWDNGLPYDGSIPGWSHRLKEQGFRCDSIGKLHFRSTDDDNGFCQEIEPLHVVDGIGDVLSCIRENPPHRDSRPGLLEAKGGESTYLSYDIRNAENAVSWISEHAKDVGPWVLFVSMVCPHPPFIGPPEWFDRYLKDDLPEPPQGQPETWPTHPAITRYRDFFNLGKPLGSNEARRVQAAYYASISHLDAQIGRVLGALSRHNLRDVTRVIYTSDHGESLGARGLYGKFTHYEEASAVPMILTGPGVPTKKVVHTPVSLVDLHPTVLAAVGAAPVKEDAELPGESLWAIARGPERDRTVFSEYHAVGSRHGNYMLRDTRFKYIHYLHEPPQLFDLIADPQEQIDLADLPRYRPTLKNMESRLRSLLDPEAVDVLAKADQQARVESLGGKDQVLQRGTFTNSPAPGEEAKFIPY
jgi:choline-sulfatase